MKLDSPQTPPEGPAYLAQALLKTLAQEGDALRDLQARFQEQLDALRERRPEHLEQHAMAANDVLGRMDQLQQTRERQQRLLGRVLRIDDATLTLEALAARLCERAETRPAGADLLQLRQTIRAQAREAQQRQDALAFALQYSIHLGMNMLQAIQDLKTPPPARMYNAAGGSTEAARRSLVNRVG